jgi:hypothetical protein
MQRFPAARVTTGRTLVPARSLNRVQDFILVRTLTKVGLHICRANIELARYMQVHHYDFGSSPSIRFFVTGKPMASPTTQDLNFQSRAQRSCKYEPIACGRSSVTKTITGILMSRLGPKRNRRAWFVSAHPRLCMAGGVLHTAARWSTRGCTRGHADVAGRGQCGLLHSNASVHTRGTRISAC